jgi:hypothetical protein
MAIILSNAALEAFTDKILEKGEPVPATAKPAPVLTPTLAM